MGSMIFNKTFVSLLTILSIFLVGCFIISSGTHGSLKGYQYMITKNHLDSAVIYVIKNNPKIYRDTNNINYVIEEKDGKIDTTIDTYYNDGKTYLTIKIKTEKGQCEYTFRYYGSEEDWKIASTSEISICYAYDETGIGGSEGNGEIDEQKLKYLTAVFEKELVEKVDKKLNRVHFDKE